jgi:hypothetical protein
VRVNTAACPAGQTPNASPLAGKASVESDESDEHAMNNNKEAAKTR